MDWDDFIERRRQGRELPVPWASAGLQTGLRRALGRYALGLAALAGLLRGPR